MGKGSTSPPPAPAPDLTEAEEALVLGRVWQQLRAVIRTCSRRGHPRSNPLGWELCLFANGAGQVNYDFVEVAGWAALSEAEAALARLVEQVRAAA